MCDHEKKAIRILDSYVDLKTKDEHAKIQCAFCGKISVILVDRGDTRKGTRGQFVFKAV